MKNRYVLPFSGVVIFLGLVWLVVYTKKESGHQTHMDIENVVKQLRMDQNGPVERDDIDLYRIPASLEQMSVDQLFEVYSKITNSFQILCRNHMRIGNLGATGKEICADFKTKPYPPCLIYSFGSNNQFQFEEAAVYFLKCEVHTFDHTLGRFKTINSPQNVTVHDKGLDGKTDPEKKLWTLDDIIKSLGHEGRTIDILKLDIEEYEYPALDQMISSGTLRYVKQLLVEFHLHLEGEQLTKEIIIKRLLVFSRLYDYGFRSFSREKTGWLAEYIETLHYKVSFLVEISYINTRYL